MISDDIKVTLSSGNVFEDMGLDGAEELLGKADLSLKIAAIIRDRGLSQTAAAQLLKIDQPKVSKLVRGELYGFSTDQLIRFLNQLGQVVTFTVRPKKKLAKKPVTPANKKRPGRVMRKRSPAAASRSRAKVA